MYSKPDCPRCVHAKNTLATLGYRIEERSAEALARGDIRDDEALTELTMTDGALPVVVADGRAVSEGSELYQRVHDIPQGTR